MVRYSEVQNKYAKHKFDALYKIWLGILDMFQTFDDLESVKDKPADIRAIRELLEITR
jgi:hypothetical protein